MNWMSKFLHESSNKNELLKFCITGGVSTITMYVCYYVLLKYLGTSIAFTLSYIVAFVINYILTTTFTFNVRATSKNGIGFVVSNVINYILSLAFLHLFIFMGVSKTLAPIPMYAVCIPINFLIVRFVMKR